MREHQDFVLYVSNTLFDMLIQQVAEPLRAMVMGAPLEDARHLTQRYERLRQEAEAQVWCPNCTKGSVSPS